MVPAVKPEDYPAVLPSEAFVPLRFSIAGINNTIFCFGSLDEFQLLITHGIAPLVQLICLLSLSFKAS
jgi:hypothetical protein